MSSITQEDKNNLAVVASRLDQVISGLTKLGVAYVGYKATNHWTGALTGLIALKMAEGGNLAGGAAGTAVLGLLGLTQMPPVQIPESDIDPNLLPFLEWTKIPIGP